MRILYLVLLFSLAIGNAVAQLSPNSTLEQLLVQSFHANINAERVVLNHIGIEAVEVSNGYLVTAVLEGYPAHVVDIRRGDIIEKADGMSYDGNSKSILNVPFPKDIHQRTPIFFGSEYEIFKLL